MIPYGKQSISEEDLAAVRAVLESDFLTSGPEIERFEAALAEACGARHAVAVCNATAALHLAMRVSGLGPGDRVVTSPVTFVASANAGEYVGAEVDFADVSPDDANIDPSSVAALAQERGLDAIVAVDYAGRPADLPALSALAKEHGAVLIADCCHAIGTRFQVDGTPYRVGGNPFADITTFSFHPVKTITSGEGGALVTDNAEFAARARALRSHSVVRTTDPDPDSPHLLEERGTWFYEMRDLGYNYRLTDFQAALGHSQLARLPAIRARRQAIAARYGRELAGVTGLTLPQLGCQSGRLTYAAADLCLHLYPVRIDFAGLGTTRTEVMAALAARGVGTQVHYIPVHLQPYYREKYGYAEGKCPEAETFYRQCLSLPLHPGMTDADNGQVISAVREVLARTHP
ncbi:UDP-4-amino-4,6-dideoxy-N-acetyl-beta-L-altrosamine transaminase [soil metagenome]